MINYLSRLVVAIIVGFILVIVRLVNLFKGNKLKKSPARIKQTDDGVKTAQPPSAPELTVNLAMGGQHLSDNDLFALSLGDIANGKSIANITNQQQLLKYMKTTWGMEFEPQDVAAERTIHCLKQIWNQGHIDSLLNSPQHFERVAVRDIIAIDTARFVQLVVQTRALDLIDEHQAWGLLYLNAQRALDSFDSWSDFEQAGLTGQTFLRSLRTKHKLSDFELYLKSTTTEFELSFADREKSLAPWPQDSMFSALKVSTIMPERLDTIANSA